MKKTIRNVVLGKYEFEVNNQCWMWDYSTYPPTWVSGWQVQRQKINGKDGRAHPRVLHRFFGPSAHVDAIALFEHLTDSE